MSDLFGPSRPSVVTDCPDDVEADVVIIGSGMGGGTLAYALRDSGARILIVEQGDFLPRELENWSRSAVHLLGRYKNSATWYDAHGNGFVPGNYHYVGGSTKLYGATLPRFREHDFDAVEHADGVSPAWPIGYDDLEPYYAAAERIYWVHGNKGEDPTEPRRSTDFPYPAVPYEPTVGSFADSARQQGLHPFALPQAIDIRPGGRCVRCATCDAFPCMLDAKGDADVAAVRPAINAPNVKLLTRTSVTRLETDAAGRRVTVAHATSRGNPVRIRGGRFVVAAGAVNTAALLLRSASDTHPQGLANSSDQVGRNYMAHVTTFLLAVDALHTNKDVYTKTLGINDWYAAGPTNSHPLGNVQGLGKLRGEMVKQARKWVPLPILDAVTRRTLDLFLQTEDLPLPESRVRLNASGDVVLNRVQTNLTANDELISRMTEVARRAGYAKVLHQRLGVEATSHQCGTARMGTDSATSVVDSYCKAYDLDNMWIVDSSPFPSSAAVNPALTVAALALRVADSDQLIA
jgi:choline dehydrogenase-like flavoprotein